MMGRGAEGGTHQLVGISSVHGSKVRPQSLGVDIYSQVLKAVASKIGSRDDLEYPGAGALPLLAAPISLKVSASFDSKRKYRAKKTQPKSREGGPVSKKRHYVDDPSASGDANPGQIWTQMDEFFRSVTPSDIQLLLPTTCPLLTSDGTVSDPCLLIPTLGRHYTEKWAEEEAEQEAELAKQRSVTRVKRKLLAASPVSKKSKKSGELVTTVISPPPENEDEEELCHVCNGGDSDESNQIIFCDVCNVAVHQECYGVRLVPEGQWLCSWCNQRTLMKTESNMGECLLCPVKGGALKPAVEVDSKGNIIKTGLNFAHLFCSQWTPETYIGNMEAMEPIRNIEGVREERWRLLCSVCKEKHGACIQCSHGMCATAFHPLCARDAKLLMEVSSTEDSEDIEFRAFCSKHSSTRMGKVYLPANEGSDSGTPPLKSIGDQEVVNKSSDSGVPGSASLSEGKTLVMEISSEEQPSPSSHAIHQQAFDNMKFKDGQCLPDISLDDVEGNLLSVKLAIQENGGAAGEASNHTKKGIASITHQGQIVVSCGEAKESSLRVTRRTQGSHVAGSPSLQSCDASQSSHLESTSSMKPKAGKMNTEPHGKTEVSSKLSISALRLDRHSSDATSKGSRGQEVCDLAQADGSGELVTVWDEKGSEERRQRGLSGEASTSHSHATSPSDSHAVTAQTSASPSSHKLDEKEVRDPSTGVNNAELSRVSTPSNMEDTGKVDPDAEKPACSSAEKVSRKSLRHSAVRADIGKLSISTGNKVGSRLRVDAQKPGAEREQQVGTSKKPSVTEKVESPQLSGKIEDVEGYSLEQRSELTKHACKPLDVDTNRGADSNQIEGKVVLVFQSGTLPDSEEEVSQTPATTLDSLHGNSSSKPINKSPQANAHPLILQRLRDSQQSSGVLLGIVAETGDRDEADTSSTSQPCPRVVEVTNQIDNGVIEKQWEQLQEAEKEGVLKLAPDDEIEGEILVLQDMLLSCAQGNRVRCERLIGTLMPQMAEEQASSHRRAQELSFVHQYLSQAREAKKQGRKERRDKEAQAVLAAATAAAAASPRVGYVKRDSFSVFDTENHPLTPVSETVMGHSPGLIPNSIRYSKPPVPKPTKLLSTPANLLPPLSARSGAQARTPFQKSPTPGKLAMPRTGAERLQWQGEESLCEICSSGESSRLNKIVTCDSCKVAVHQDCYGIGRVPLGAWLCQPCIELQRQSPILRSPGVDAQASKPWVQCALCYGRGGAFKRSTDGRWVHVFCAQWMPETIVGKDQAAPIEGMENVMLDRYALLCSICQRQEGACLKCNFGHCHGAFHPTCARESGMYMTVRASAGGRLNYRAYCERHSPLQRAKDEQVEQKQRSGTEEMHALRQIRVEFERVRLICERICRRERLKRDVLQSTKDVCIAQLISAGHSGLTELGQSQTSELFASDRDITSTLPREVSLATMQQMAGNHHRDQLLDNRPRDEAKEHTKRHKKFKKHGETKLHREKLMTPIEASMQNMRLPKGYAYVPVDVYVKGTIAGSSSDLLEKQPLPPPPSLPL